MKNTIVFGLKVDNEESYAKVAKFIYKREHKECIDEDDVNRVCFKYYLRNNKKSMKEWATSICKDVSMFSKINEPNKIKNITEEYEIIYCFYVDKNADIIELSNLYLIKKYYSQLKIVILFPQCGSRYYAISQFLYSVCGMDNEFYNECFFDYRGNIQRAQRNEITFSRNFTPLQIVDQENVKRLFAKCKDLVTVESIYSVDLYKKSDTEKYDDLLQGSIKILLDVEKKSKELFSEDGIRILQKLDVFGFVLLCFILANERNKVTVTLLEKYAYQAQQYSNAVHQLVENIVFHSKTGCGIVAFRIHNKGSVYVEDKYQISDSKNTFLEIIVSDFCGENVSGNIADNFLAKLNGDTIKRDFANLQPRSFFDHEYDDRINIAWEEFYKNPDNIGKHFGLKIFQTVVSYFDGIFRAESHSDYTNVPGDSFSSYERKELMVCMPGTRYCILFPIENVQKVIRKQDLSLDSGISISEHINEYFNYSIGEIDLPTDMQIPQSQQLKNDFITQISNSIKSELKNNENDIIYVSLENADDSSGEIIAKALTIALFGLKRDVVVVLYQCTKNLKKSIFDTMRVFFCNTDIEGMFFGRKVQIVLYSSNFEECVLELDSMQKTDSINSYIAHMKCAVFREGYLSTNLNTINLKVGALNYIPCDVLGRIKISGKNQTLFEHYTEWILRNSIQKDEFGCQLEHTHMRLGSTIHIDKFYEAEILFGNKLFVSRFALLLVKDMREEIENISKLTLYGYGTYSETILVQMIEMINQLYLNSKDVDYIILEREEERRGFLHKDRIRYNRYFESKEERINYFRERKVAIVVLINSTLKTHMRLINLFKEENDIAAVDKTWLVKNYAVILVGDEKGNNYWILNKNKVVLYKENIVPVPQYFIHVETVYQEPSECSQCFPTVPVAELPLIEVNAASTIPNQAFGILNAENKEKINLSYDLIKREEDKLKYLKEEFTYGHVHRNENHFLYYFKTENICVKYTKEITDSLRKWKREQNDTGTLEYNIIVAPMHFSNAGFVELVNNIVFDGNAILLRIDFDKEYRCNAYTKYSYLRNYIKQLSVLDSRGSVNVHYVDDAIISGRTFYRAKSLVKSILNLEEIGAQSLKINVFDKVFVLVDRNSNESRNQYVDNPKNDFYTFVKVNISSLRNYGDSCVYCNLKKEADLLLETASTKLIAKYWNNCSKKFQLYSLEQYNEECERQYVENHKQIDYDKQFRRLFCTHMAQCVLTEKYHGNDTTEAIYLILKLINIDYGSRGKERYEYFMSYLKCISRPFLVFNKAVKEAIFDIMLIVIEAIVCNASIRKVIAKVESQKTYLKKHKLIAQFNILDNLILQSIQDKKDLVKLLMKQLTELKSNYIIRPEKMDLIFKFMEGENSEEFKKYYITLIDRLVGASSDTNKSIWLDDKIINSQFEYVPEDFRVWILLENTRAFRDGIEKFYNQIYGERVGVKKIDKAIDNRICELEESYNYRRAVKMFDDFEKKHEHTLQFLEKSEDTASEITHNMEKKVKRFLESLPQLKTIDVASVISKSVQANITWYQKFNIIRERIMEDYTCIEKEQQLSETKDEIFKWLQAETDIYQYNNFYRILEEEGYNNANGLQIEGVDIISCCVKILELCRSKHMDILEKIHLLAMLFRVILRAEKVQFITENSADNNLYEWKVNIEKTYNKIVDAILKEEKSEKLKHLCLDGKKCYFVIVEKAGCEDYNTEVSMKTENLIARLESDEKNYLIDSTDGSVLWKLENNHRSIWVNIENSKWCTDEFNESKIARDIRKIMMFYQELMKEIFNSGNDDYINEISHAKRELNIYHSNKVHTHTKEYSRDVLFEQAKAYFQNDCSNEQLMKNFPSYVLKLLADINISQHYRYGLKAKMYQDDRGIKNAAKWKDFTELIRNEQKYTYCISNQQTISIKLDVNNIQDDTEVLCRNSLNSIREMGMMIFAIILNAGEQNRGKRRTTTNTAIHSQEESVIVKIYKEEGALVIKNECEGSVDLVRIKRKLQQIPDPEDDGISLWSFNCYIKRCISSIILAKLKEIERSICEGGRNINEICNVGQWISRLTSSEFEIQVEQEKQQNEELYFKVKLPIFMEKYRLDIGRKESENE